jgi:hypothetical protein
MNNPGFFLMGMALLASIVFMFIAFQMLAGTHFFCALSAPLVTVVNPPGQEAGFDSQHQKYRGFFSLTAIYFFTAFAIAFTNGHIGVFHFNKPGVETLYWSFSIGILVVALARFASVLVSASFARHLELLIVFFGGVLTYLLVTRRDMFQDRPFQEAEQWFILFAVLAAPAAVLLTEGCILLMRIFRTASRIPYSLMNERIQEYAHVEQVFEHVFVASEVERFTDRHLEKIVLNEGLTQLSWVTQTPPPHLQRLEPTLQLTMTRQGIQRLLRDQGLLWHRLYRDERGIVHIKPSDIAVLKPILKSKGMLDSFGRITGQCSPAQLREILKENKIAEKLSSDGLGEIESSRYEWLTRMVEVLQTADYAVEIGKAANVSKCPWLNRLAALLASQDLGLQLVSETEVLNRINSVTKVIVASDQPTPNLLRYQMRKLHIDRPTRARYMVINGRYVIVHLPTPFTGRPGEQSNCAHWSDQAAIVTIYWNKFKALWESLLHQREAGL